MELTDIELRRFKAKYHESGDCWLWIGNKSWNGYGYFKVQGRRERAHRVAYNVSVGKIPRGLCVLHRCDVRNCVNPRHLFLGTLGDNCRDRTRKGRTAKGEKNGANTHPELNPVGERNGMSKLTTKQVREIRRLLKTKLSQRKIAAKFGIVQQQVSQIKVGKSWSRVK